jgi:hypothetical protein
VSKDTTTTQSQTTTADPTTLAREQQLWDAGQRITSQPYQGYTGQQVAGFTPDQQAGFEAARRAAGMGAPAVETGVNYATQAGAYNPLNISPQFAGPAATADPSGVNAMYAAYRSGAPSAAARDVSAQDAVGRISQYLNPWTDEVVNASLADQERQRQIAIASGQARATAAGAYGGSRHGVADSLTNEAALREAGMLSANARAAGFNTALGAATGDANRNLQGQMSNQAADVATSTANANNATSLFGQQAGINANLGMFNAGQVNNMGQFNSSLAMTADQANQGAGLTANAQKLGAAGQLGSLGQLQQGMGLTGADALTRIGGMQQGLNQANLDVAHQEWLREQADPYNKIMFQQGLIGTPGQVSRGKTTQEGSVVGGLIGAASTIAGGPLGGAISNMFGGGPQIPGGNPVPQMAAPQPFTLQPRGPWTPTGGYG